MADYYSILEKTIAGLPSNTPEIRNAVYKKARTAIETQLRNMDPAPSEEAIGSQLKLLEEAIVLINSENAVAPPAAVVEEVAPQAPAAPIAPEPPHIEPETVSLPVEPEVAPLQVEPETASLQEPSPLPEPIVERAETIVESIPDPISDAIPNAIPNSVVPEAPSLEVPSTLGLDAPDVSMNTQASLEAEPIAQPVDVVAPEVATMPDDPAISAEVNSEDNMGGELLEEPKSGGFLGGLFKLLLTLGIIGGAGYAIWKNKDVLSELTSGLMSSSTSVEQVSDELPKPELEVTTQEPNEIEVPAVVIEPEIKEPELTEQIIPEPRVVEPEIVTPEILEPTVIEPSPVETTQVEPSVTEEIPATTQQNGVIPIGEVAYLYEEGSAGSGATRRNAGVTWDLKQESLQDGLPAESVIIGKMDIAEKNMSLNIRIARNVDPAISATHIIEVVFSLPEDFSGQTIESIARFVMKASEEAPGEPLVAVPFKASESKFLIALDNLPQAVSINRSLLRDAGWIDIPLVYGTGRRALLTLEKGGTGERVFTEAFKDWQNR